jgi:antagonist of KipI
MDTYSHRLANLLVENRSDAATLEVTLVGPELVFEGDTTVAVAGAAFGLECRECDAQVGTSFQVASGARLRFGPRPRGARAYIALAGGMETPMVLGSRATHLVSQMGGVAGRALRAGDVLPIAEGRAAAVRRHASGLTLPADGSARLRVLAGAQADWFASGTMETFTTSPFRVGADSNRMGYRLDGPPLSPSRPRAAVSGPVSFGSIQVPPDGRAILLMADRQTAGGYPLIATVISADLPLAGQLAPGDTITFSVLHPCGRACRAGRTGGRADARNRAVACMTSLAAELTGASARARGTMRRWRP